jgi:hypothetical protein
MLTSLRGTGLAAARAAGSAATPYNRGTRSDGRGSEHAHIVRSLVPDAFNAWVFLGLPGVEQGDIFHAWPCGMGVAHITAGDLVRGGSNRISDWYERCVAQLCRRTAGRSAPPHARQFPHTVRPVDLSMRSLTQLLWLCFSVHGCVDRSGSQCSSFTGA